MDAQSLIDEAVEQEAAVKRIALEDLCQEQKDAFDRIMRSDKHIILTGQAGSGKSTLIHALTSSLGYGVCATTGKAALNVNGCTVDAMFALDRNTWKPWSEGYLEYLMRRIPDTNIIDEGSMVGKNMGDYLHMVAHVFKKRFILVGDWAQARPVLDDWILGSKLLEDYEFIKLVENHRQSDSEYMEALNKIRLGETDEFVNRLFSDRIAGPPEGDRALRMFATNKMAGGYNNSRLNQHISDKGAKPFTLEVEFVDMRPAHAQERKPRTQKFIDNAIKSSRLALHEVMAPGCRVIFTLNSRPLQDEFVNGDTGDLVGFVEAGTRDVHYFDEVGYDMPFSAGLGLRVRLDRTGKEVTVFKMCQYTAVPGANTHTPPELRFLHGVIGWPLKLGYALTIHKSQGMTVHQAWVDLDSIFQFPSPESTHGLAYVALSRTTSLEGLTLSSWHPEAVICDRAITPLL